jgi:ribonucleotide monophosphatase NagD (HAD superfamily)
VIYRGEVVTCSPILKRWAGVRRATDALDRLRAQGWRVEFITNNGEGTERR